MTTLTASRDHAPETASRSAPWRVARRGVAFTLWTIAIGSAVILGSLLLLPAKRARRQWQATCCSLWGRVGCPLIGVSIDVRGTPPEAPFLLVSNHLGYLDILTLGSVLHGVFVSKSEVASWPLIGACARGSGTVFVERGKRMDVKRVNAEIDERRAHGIGATLFPEGTSSQGAEVLPFRASLLEPAAAARAPVHHVTVRYETPAGAPPASTHVAWWGDMTFVDHLRRMLALPSVHATITFGAEPIVDDDRRRLAARLHAAITEHFEPLAPPEAAWTA